MLVSSKGLQAKLNGDLHMELRCIIKGTVIKEGGGICWCRDNVRIGGRNKWNSLDSGDPLTGHCPTTALCGATTLTGNEVKDLSDGGPTWRCMTERRAHRFTNTPLLFSPALATHLSCLLRWYENVAQVGIQVYMKPNNPWLVIIIDLSG